MGAYWTQQGSKKLQTAQELRIRELYRYQSYNLDWLMQTLQDNVIFLSNPNGFNDPWDCRPHFYSDVDNPDIRKSVIKYYANAHRKAFPNGENIDVEKLNRELDANPDKLKALMNKTSEGVAEEIDKQYRICCLTTKPSCPLMWGHYSEKHTGVCLEFKVRNEAFCGALKVEYVENYPPFQLTDDAAEANVKVLTSKSQDWAYEDEFRLIALEKNTNLPTGNMLVTNNGLLSIPEGSLNAIIVGCMMPEKDRNELKKIIDSSGKSVQLKEAVRLPHKYGLTINDIEI